MSSDIKQRLRVADVDEAFIGKHGVELVQTELGLEAADRIEALEGEAARLRAALQAIAEKAGKFEGYGSYIAYVELAGEIEKMADAARNGEEP
jgi:hypothetical protein